MNPIPCTFGAVLAIAICTGSAEAQNVGFAPSIGNGTASTYTSYPWNRQSSSVRVQYSYDPSEVPGNGTILITRIKFRPSDTFSTATTWVGGTYGGVVIQMSHGAQPYNQLGSTFSTNHGANLATVYSGAVKLLPGSGTGTNVPSKPYVDITLQKIFVYQPSQGPLLIDIASDGSKWVANSTGTATVGCACTYTSDPKKATRMYNLTSHTATTGSVQAQVGLVMEITYAGGGGTGVTTIGQSCSDGFGKFGSHFTNQKPTLGNASFNLEGNTLPPSAAALLIIGANKSFQSIELSPYGAPNCYLHSDSVVELALQTTSGTPSLSNGTLNLPAPIPNDSGLKGAYVRTQLAVADANSKRPFKVVFTNGLGITVQ